MAPRIQLMLDSGAFSSWKKGEELNLQDYISYIKSCDGLLSSYVCLDSIPGNAGNMDRSQAEIEKSAAASYRNQQAMKDAGLSPIPVFHQGERFEWLEKYLADDEVYVGISPYLKNTSKNIIQWLDRVFSILVDGAGAPLVKTHGFGVSHPDIILRYPWQSVDSTSWHIAPSHGLARFAQVTSDGAISRGSSRLVYVGRHSAAAIMHKTDMLDLMSDAELGAFEGFLSACEITLPEVRYDASARMTTFLKHYRMLEAAHAPEFRTRASFARVTRPTAKARVELRVIAATSLSGGRANFVLNEAGAASRLVSYYLTRHQPVAAVEEYVSSGTLGKRALAPSPRVGWRSESYMDYRSLSAVKRFA